MVVCTRTQEEYLDVEHAFSKFCDEASCVQCPFDNIVPCSENCDDFVRDNPEEAMRIMGLEDKEEEHFEFNEDAFKDLMGGALCLNA